jgi:hypothetical protein
VLATASRLREQVAASKLTHDGQTLSVTMSGGVAIYPEDGSDWDRLFTVADRRLYAAKTGGRNRVEGPASAQPQALSFQPVTAYILGAALSGISREVGGPIANLGSNSRRRLKR